MIPHDLVERRKVIKYMLAACVELEFLSKWESDFLDSIIDQFGEKGNLSDDQCKVLERIYDKV